MEFEYCLYQMTNNAQTIRAFVQGVAEPQARWKPTPTSWSILEVINHLVDEESEDFQTHIDFILHDKTGQWPRINPQQWAVERGYNQRDLAQSIQNFMVVREASVKWLRSLESPAWETTCKTPFGQIKAEEVLLSWVAHDLLHLRQLVKLHWLYLIGRVGPDSVRYAGNWS
ncbi:MAG: DinB family protein [Anaerolineae bacterium]|nr:DinB family protein [Anaerolineae bacterium]